MGSPGGVGDSARVELRPQPANPPRAPPIGKCLAPPASATPDDRWVTRFPSMKADRLLAVLMRAPLDYRIVRQSGSHRRLVSRSRPANPVTFAYHHGTTVDPMAVRELLVNTVGLSEDEAVKLL